MENKKKNNNSKNNYKSKNIKNSSVNEKPVREKKLTPKEQQAEAMRLYMKKLRCHKTVIVPSAPKSEIEQPIKYNVDTSVTTKKKKSKKKIDSSTPKIGNKKRKVANNEWMCSRCRTKKVWLSYNLCYECYMHKTSNLKEKKHWAGGKMYDASQDDSWSKDGD